MAMPLVAIVGRPNVGKSTLFNRIVGGRTSIVDDQPGVTRDRIMESADWNGRAFQLVDTGGLVPGTREVMEREIAHQVEAAIGAADVILFVVDARSGITGTDQEIAERLRREAARVLLVANKVDRPNDTAAAAELHALGLGEPHAVSAIQGLGSGDLLDRIVQLLPQGPEEDLPPGAIRLAILGKPNVGKSSFVNRLLGEERVIVSPVAGTTRDSVDTRLVWRGRDVVLIDTAGLRKTSSRESGIEYYTYLRTLAALERSDVAVVLLDAHEALARQDLRVLNLVAERGKGLVAAVNKWDLVEAETGTAEAYERAFREMAPSLAFVPVVFVSARTGKRVERALELAWEVGEARRRRMPTPEVNRVLGELVRRYPPPLHRGRPVRLLYANQVAAEPPTFVIFTNDPASVTDTYRRYVENGMREAWEF
ncbi:MAG: ribosome biogenesis GTPase Der, partial [Gemmatimonadetes bacterium]|nr:ribosome biogenesis GTPase Der [Gemmatimonadota bacterium]